MISVAAIRMQQFGVQFYQASLTANDIDKLVRFEVLSYGEQAQAPVRGGKKQPTQSKIHWDLLERRIASSEKAYQRHIIRRKIEELVQYYEQCRQARDLPSIPGAVIISADEKLSFEPVEAGSMVGRLKVPEREGVLSAIDGQHRLLALHADIENFADEQFTVPAIIFDRLPEDHVVQMFVTINAKHTRLNSSHLVSLSGRQLYRDESLAAAHDVVRALNDREESPLYGEIKLLGVGRGRVAQAPLAQELKRLFADEDALGGARKAADFREESKKFFVNYLKQIATLFESAWNGRKYSDQVRHCVACLHPRCARRDPADRSAACRSDRLSRDWPRDRAVGTSYWRVALRDRRRVEASGDDGRCTRQRVAAGACSIRRERESNRSTVDGHGYGQFQVSRLPASRAS